MRPKKCACCRQEFTPQRMGQKVCCIECAQAIARKKREKVEKAADRKKRESLKSRAQWLKEAQAAFNSFIRERDNDMPCICCGRFASSDDLTPGGTWDAGHFLSRGAYPELRFEETNCHKQLKTCNAGSAKYAKKGRTVSQGYREGLVARIGLEQVEWLEGHHEPKKYTIDELKHIKAFYSKKAREIREKEV